MICMELDDALDVLAENRREAVIVSTIDFGRDDFQRPQHRLDFCYEPSSLGGGPMLALGLAIAQPAREVIALFTETELLADLGCLATLLASPATNISLIVLSSPPRVEARPSAFVADHDPDRMANIARAAGFSGVSHFDDLTNWQHHAKQALNSPAPRFIQLSVRAHPHPHPRTTPAEMATRISRLREALT